ncbi:hypothetical protein B0J17DRAFT_674304 [Rhizoctonia solani]|nr:hypothetical protein B0J17DRAFT_674304 [Rhizoctonia solani]
MATVREYTRILGTVSHCKPLSTTTPCSQTHGNLKGSKILVSGDGTPQITLHGIYTHMVDEVDAPWEAGTPRWMAPELLGGVVTTSLQSDVYALGMTILASNRISCLV